ncbi:MAG TPA: hypothetical protein VNH46_08190, partial [Gemmatimonadales bacterium]|nr:hypothetical protein [Gemmatimonadales bacterium]
CLTLGAPALAAQTAPRSGREVVERMHAAYEGKWYRNLTFVQTTTINRAGAAPTEQTWYETMAAPGLLRIDIADPDSGNGAIYTRDSLFAVRGGTVVRRLGGGNPFLPLIMGVYVQPPEETVTELEAYHYDLSKVMVEGSGASAVWVVGTTTPGDTVTPQFRVEPGRLVVTRIIAEVAPNVVMDADLGGYVAVGPAWLATTVKIGLPGGRSQEETYRDWRANRNLPAGFFDPAQWLKVPHWAHEEHSRSD